jgi:UDP-2-acetamido-3-amino-2,3-dideoxy-glucuronate N-acetyltransferase
MTISCAVLGTGYWGKNILRNLDALGALTGFFDSDPEARTTFGAQYPTATVYSDLGAPLSDASVQAVAIATPAETHGALVRQALEAGKHVFVEKPLCLEVEEARALQALAAQKGNILMVGHLLLYHPAFLALKKAVEDGAIGRLRYVYSTRASLGKIRRNENALWSFAPHDISMMLALTGRMPTRVVCNGEAWLSPSVADMTLSHFDFGDQLQGHIFVSWMHPFKDHRLVVVGEAGMLVFNDTLPGEEKLQRYPHAIGWEDDLPVMDKADAVPVPYGTEEPLRSEMEHFLDCCAKGITPRSDAAEGVRVLSVLDMCQRSLDSKSHVSWEEE